MLKQLAKGLEIPTAGSAEELRTFIEGKLGEMEHDPKNTQVLVQEGEHGVHACLQDANGVFLEVEPEADEGDGSGEGDGDGVGAGDVEGLRLELQAVKDAQEALEKEVNELRQKLERDQV